MRRSSGRILRSTLAAKVGTANRLMSWRHFDAHLLERILTAVPHQRLLSLACHVINNPAAARTGFPDLLVINDGAYEFVEVKGPTDVLRPTQRIGSNSSPTTASMPELLKFRVAKANAPPDGRRGGGK